MKYITEDQLAHKPEGINEARRCTLSVPVEEVEILDLERVTMDLLEEMTQSREASGLSDQFCVYELLTEDVFVVDSQGYSYVRKLGLLSTRDARAVYGEFVRRREEKHTPPAPRALFSGFQEMDARMRQAYEGCEGDAQIAFVSAPNDEGVWQFDLVLDKGQLQIHYNALAGDFEAIWGMTLRRLPRDLALRLANCVAKALVDEDFDVLDSIGNLGNVTELVGHYGLQRII